MPSYVAALGQARPAINVAALVGHSTLRVATMDDPYRAAPPAEQAKMADLMLEATPAGAAGFSSGLFYEPTAASDTAEVTLSLPRAAYPGGVYAALIRDEAKDV